jgi:hypothetical protein
MKQHFGIGQKIDALLIAGHQRQAVYQRSPCHKGVTKRHFSLLAKGHRLVKDGL